MNTINNNTKIEQTINKSIFICQLFIVKTVDDAKNTLNIIKKKYYDATHNCYAYIIGDDGSIAKFSDDGEPSQTAGIVMYNILKSNNLTNVLAIVTRYFGGIKLGAGGLVRAYSSSVSLALKETKIIEIINYKTIQIIFDYPNYDLINNLLKEYSLITNDFSDKVFLKYLIPEYDIEKIKIRLFQITKNNINFSILS